jgi:hypothetical protein
MYIVACRQKAGKVEEIIVDFLGNDERFRCNALESER